VCVPLSEVPPPAPVEEVSALISGDAAFVDKDAFRPYVIQEDGSRHYGSFAEQASSSGMAQAATGWHQQ